VKPSYIQLDSFSFQGNGPDSTGYPTHKITEAWIYVNNQFIGTYSFPTQKIPVLAKGSATLSVHPGVFTDGVRKNRVSYPFYEPYETKIQLEEGKVTSSKPYFKYKPFIKKSTFAYYQDFETTGSGITKGDFGTVEVNREVHPNTIPENKFGRRYAHLVALNNTDVLEYSSEEFVVLKTNKDPVYLEFDYKSTCDFTVGVKAKINASFGSASDLILMPASEWTKIYVSLADETANFNATAANQQVKARFTFFLRSITTPGTGNSISIDNIRLINTTP
jgi:hypothetical protein